MRIAGLLGLVALVTATTCSTSTVIAVAPVGPAAEYGATDSAIALVSRVVAAHGFEPHRRGSNEEGWTDCLVDGTIRLCRRVDQREAQFLLFQTRTTRFAPRADSLRHEVLDSLRARFGEQQVHECQTRDECDDRPH